MTAPRLLVVQHTAGCPPLRLGEALAVAGAVLDVRRPDLGEPLPDGLDDVDGLVVLGGEMGAGDDAAHPWLTPTKALLAAAVTSGLPTLGVCLGHQLLAVAAGGRVRRNPAGPQLGVRTVGLTAAAADDPLLGGLAATAETAEPPVGAHWNHDLVVEPAPGSTVLARTVGADAGTVQAVRVGRAAWGVQWHPEVDPPTLRAWAESDVAAGDLSRPEAEALLAAAAAVDDRLRATWAPLGTRFAHLAATR